MKLKEKLKRVVFALLLFWCIFSSGFFVGFYYSVGASYTGGWFIADFYDYLDNTYCFNESFAGDKWAYFNGSGVGHIDDATDRYGTESGGDYNKVLWSTTLYENFEHIFINHTIYQSVTAGYTSYRFYDSTNTWIASLHYSNGAYSLDGIYYDNLTSGVGFQAGDTAYCVKSGLGTKIDSNLSINFDCTSLNMTLSYGDGTVIGYVQDNDFSGYISKIVVKSTVISGYSDYYVYQELFKCSGVSNKNPWDLTGYEKVGNVAVSLSSIGYLSHSITNDYYLAEEKYFSSSSVDIYIKQVALSCWKTNDVGNVVLYLGNENSHVMVGSYDAVFSFDADRLIYVWQDIDYTLVGGSPVFEFLATKGSNGAFDTVYSRSDIDFDGELTHRYSDGLDALNDKDGSYNAMTQNGHDLSYEFYCDLSAGGYSWQDDTGYEIGGLGLNSSNMTVFSKTLSGHYLLLEQRFRDLSPNSGYNIYRVGLSINNSSSIGNLSCSLKINGLYQGSYSSRYFDESNNESYIYIWDDLDFPSGGNTLLFEWLFYSANVSDTVDYQVYSLGDIDGDGSSSHKYYCSQYADQFWDGSYNAFNSGSGDLVYSFWYTSQYSTVTVESGGMSQTDVNNIIGLIIVAVFCLGTAITLSCLKVENGIVYLITVPIMTLVGICINYFFGLWEFWTIYAYLFLVLVVGVIAFLIKKSGSV